MFVFHDIKSIGITIFLFRDDFFKFSMLKCYLLYEKGARIPVS